MFRLLVRQAPLDVVNAQFELPALASLTRILALVQTGLASRSVGDGFMLRSGQVVSSLSHS